MAEMIGVQLVKGGHVQYCLTAGKRYPLDTYCVVETEHGLQMGRVVRPIRNEAETNAGGGVRKVVRVATARDFEQRKLNEKAEHDAYRLCREKVQHKGLAMKLVGVNYTLDGRKAIFFFTADNRVDFRELVKELAQALKVKIEMRQIGVRDEARRLGGVGCCGQPLCCCTFLRDFVSVSIRMAKDQHLSLNPTKVSGLCGRLMCCLTYEYEGTGKGGKKKCEECKAAAAANGSVAVQEPVSEAIPEEIPTTTPTAAPAATPAGSAPVMKPPEKPAGSKRRRRRRKFRNRPTTPKPAV